MNCFTRQFSLHLDRPSNVPFQWSYIYPEFFIELVRNIKTINLKNISSRIMPIHKFWWGAIHKNYVIVEIDKLVECHFIHDVYDQAYATPKKVKQKYNTGAISIVQKSNNIESIVQARYLRRLERMKNMVFIVTFEEYCLKHYDEIKDVLNLDYVVLFFRDIYKRQCRQKFDEQTYNKTIFYYLNRGECLTNVKNSRNFMNQFFNSFHLPANMPCYKRTSEND